MKYRYIAIIEYDGFNYFGSQKQLNNITIQGTCEKALKNMTQLSINTYFASRTDKQVHSKYQVFHFDLDFEISNFNNFVLGLNKRLPLDIRVKRIKKVNLDFHSRHSAKAKIYQYVVAKKPISAFLSRYMVYENKLDIELIQKAILKIQGTHDFTGFSKFDPNKNPIKNLDYIKIKSLKDKYIFEFKGDSFLRYMIRSIMGLLFHIGRHEKDIEIIDKIFETKDHKLCGFTAKPHGLYLKKIIY